MWQKGHLRAQSFFLWSMICISAGKKSLFLPPKVKQDPTHRAATWVKRLRSPRARYFGFAPSPSLSSEEQVVGLAAYSDGVEKKGRCGVRTKAHTRTFMSLGSHWPSPPRLPPRTARLSFITPAPRRCKVIVGEPSQDIEYIFINFRPWFNDLVPRSTPLNAVLCV